MTERLHFHFSLSCIGEGNGNPLQCSCLENPRDGGAWWAAVYRVAQNQTQLKRLSSSSSSSNGSRRPRFGAWVKKIPWRREWLPTPVFLPAESQGWRSLAGYTLWGPTESDTTEVTWQQQQQLWIISKANFSSWYQLTPGSSSDK